MEDARTWLVACEFTEKTMSVMRGLVRIDPGRFGTTVDQCASRLLAEALRDREILVELARANGADDSEIQKILDSLGRA
jgi:hypothetical protein